MKKIGFVLVFIMTVWAGSTFGQAVDPARDLVGTWEGSSIPDDAYPQFTETLRIIIGKVENDKFVGRGRAHRGGSRAGVPTVYGTINGSGIMLEIYYPGPRNTVNYKCLLKAKTEFECSVGTVFTTVFKKMN